MRPRITVLFIVCALLASEATGEAKKPKRSGALRGSVASQKRQNSVADDHDLTRIKDLDQLERFIDQGRLVPIEDTDSYYLETVGSEDPDNAELYAHARPWVKKFLDAELEAAHRDTGDRFKITALSRTKKYQKRLCRNNAAAICGSAWWKQSSHLTGSTVDISKIDMSSKARKWLRKRLIKLEKQGKIEATEESGCFHVMVFPNYGDKPKKKLKKKAR